MIRRYLARMIVNAVLYSLAGMALLAAAAIGGQR